MPGLRCGGRASAVPPRTSPVGGRLHPWGMGAPLPPWTWGVLEDQVREGMAALDILSGRDFPLVEPQAALSTLNLVGLLYYYLLAPPYEVSPNPVVGIAL